MPGRLWRPTFVSRPLPVLAQNGRSPRRFLHGGPQRREIVGTLVPEAVNEEGGRPSHPALQTARRVLVHPVGVRVLRELLVEPLKFQAQPLCVAAEVLVLQMPLVVEEEVVHLPVAALGRRGLCRFGGSLGVRVYPGEREGPKGEKQPVSLGARLHASTSSRTKTAKPTLPKPGTCIKRYVG